jgi:hypothetical protein
MLNRPALTTRHLGRHLLAASLVLALALGYSPVHAQVVPTPAPAPKPLTANATYYVDGQKTDKDALAKINPDDISSINVLKGEKQQKIFGTSSTDGAIVVTTKANASSPTVLALAKRIEAVAPTVGPTPEQTAGMAAVQAYMAKNYPDAKIQAVGLTKQPGRYHAIFEQDGKRLQLFFDGQGNPVKE